jgi:hypothetical protein
MLYSEIIAVCSEIHTKHINTLCGQNVELLNVKGGGTYSNHWALNGSVFIINTQRSLSQQTLTSTLITNPKPHKTTVMQLKAREPYAAHRNALIQP